MDSTCPAMIFSARTLLCQTSEEALLATQCFAADIAISARPHAEVLKARIPTGTAWH